MNSHQKLQAVMDDIQIPSSSPPPPQKSAIELTGKVLLKSSEEAAQEVEALGQAALDAGKEVAATADDLARMIRLRSEAMRQTVESFLSSMQNISGELESRRNQVNDFTAELHREVGDNQAEDEKLRA